MPAGPQGLTWWAAGGLDILGLNSAACFLPPPRCITRELDRNWSSWDLNLRPIGCRHCPSQCTAMLALSEDLWPCAPRAQLPLTKASYRPQDLPKSRVLNTHISKEHGVSCSRKPTSSLTSEAANLRVGALLCPRCSEPASSPATDPLLGCTVEKLPPPCLYLPLCPHTRQAHGTMSSWASPPSQDVW